MQELTLAVVGIDFPNADGGNRLSEALMTMPGEPIELLPEPKNKHDSNAIAVISPRGVQLGYINAERAPYINSRMSRGEDVEGDLPGTRWWGCLHPGAVRRQCPDAAAAVGQAACSPTTTAATSIRAIRPACLLPRRGRAGVGRVNIPR
ncbi:MULTISPECIES: HIRAN domain-containing protein [unclassified Sphingomonas]|uniref:HIRAN domain-containing protein n=1 Tax=unclassified Sphingomonas TaxID=196159 RepID=UPI002269FBCA|nr:MULTISPECIES: HIRAN domain-containing protein [unclassified Sphingomonas]